MFAKCFQVKAPIMRVTHLRQIYVTRAEWISRPFKLLMRFRQQSKEVKFPVDNYLQQRKHFIC